MTIEVRATSSTFYLQDHERRVLNLIVSILNKDQEEGVLLPGIFLAKENFRTPKNKKITAQPENEKRAEVDCVLVLPNIVLLIELKSRATDIVSITDMNTPLLLGKEQTMENKENPLAILPRVRRPLLSRLQENGLNPFVASVFVADAYGKAFELQVGYREKVLWRTCRRGLGM